MKLFLSTIRKCLANPKSYTELRGKSFGSASRYLFALLALVGLIKIVPVAFTCVAALPNVESWLEQAKERLPELYPKGLVATIKDGQLSINQPEPYAIPLPAALRNSEAVAEGVPENLVVIDTKATADDYPNYKTIMFVTRTTAVFPDKEHSLRMVPLSNLKQDMVIDEATYRKFAEAVVGFSPMVIPSLKGLIAAMVFVGPFAYALAALCGYLFYLIFLSLVIWPLAKLFGSKASFSGVYILSMYGLTAPIALLLALSYAGLQPPFLFSAVLAIWMVLVLRSTENGTPPAA